MTDAEFTTRIRLCREPMMLILVAVVSSLLPRQWLSGAHGNRVTAIAMVAASAVWILAAFSLPPRYVKPMGIAAMLTSLGILFWLQGWN